MDKQKQKRSNIIPQMFDVRPVDESGALDWKRMSGIRRTPRTNREAKASRLNLTLAGEEKVLRKDIENEERRRFLGELKKDHTGLKNLPDGRHSLIDDKIRYAREKPAHSVLPIPEKRKIKDIRRPELALPEINQPMARRERHINIASDDENIANVVVEFKGRHEPQIETAPLASQVFMPEAVPVMEERIEKPKERKLPKVRKIKNKKQKYRGDFKFGEIFRNAGIISPIGSRSLAVSFACASLAIFIIISSVAFINKGLAVKKNSLASGQEAFANLAEAKDEIKNKNFTQSELDFNAAYQHLDDISQDTKSLGSIVIEASKYIPFVSKLGSGAHLAQAGKDISQIGATSSRILANMEKFKGAVSQSENDKSQASYLKMFQDTDNDLKDINTHVISLKDNLDEVNPDDIPASERSKFLEIKQKLPEAQQFLGEFIGYEKIFSDILGGNGPRKYLFLLQNNQEMRATGGFIGTYAVLDIFNGHIRNFFVDGIFNPDGQLMEKVVPPAPIQKISASWSLHDSNWFPDFPTSAQKAAWFYEKTGGPTVDGIITMTPTVMQKLLEVTGPIEMPDYNMTIDKDNFLENIQSEVEFNYDKTLNQPKKIISDLAPKILERIFNDGDITEMAKTMNILVESLNERHILIYSNNYDIEKALSERGWTGEVLNSDKDYLMVVNTNINGYKTDGVVDESIDHQAEIQPDGSVIDTMTVTRHHNGGDSKYDFWNKVNADYMRVYVPKGSQLISAEGQTREFDSPPLDYSALGFHRDPQVKAEEDSIKVDDATGTEVFDDAGKTVFGNWIYVSPQETAHITYKYLLPFKINPGQKTKPADSYSVLFQKQSGTIGDKLTSTMIYPKSFKNTWNYPENNITRFDTDLETGIKMETTLETDKFAAVAVTK